MKDLIKDTRVQRLLIANITGSIGSGITIVAIPWLLVHRSGGDQIYGYATIGTTVALFLFMPYYGAWIDRPPSKRTLFGVCDCFYRFHFVLTHAISSPYAYI